MALKIIPKRNAFRNVRTHSRRMTLNASTNRNRIRVLHQYTWNLSLMHPQLTEVALHQAVGFFVFGPWYTERCLPFPVLSFAFVLCVTGRSAKPDNCVNVESGESSFGQHDVSGAEFSLVKTIVAFCHCVARRAEPDVHRSSCGHAASSAPGS